jgi:hypothetical protein
MSNRFVLTALLTILVLNSMAIAVAQAADPVASKATAKVLLEQSWGKTSKARAVVDMLDLDAPELAGDPVVLAAHWLVMMYQGRHNEALESLHKFRKVKPEYLPAIRAEVWIHTAKQDHPKALLAAEELADAALAPSGSAGQSATAVQQEATAFLGRFAGFLAGPAEEDVEESLRKQLEEKVTGRLDEPRQKLFDDEKQRVLKKYRELTDAATEASNDAKQSAEAEKQRKLDDLQNEQVDLAKEAEKAGEREQEARKAFDKRIGELDFEDRKLAQSVTNLTSQAATISSQFTSFNETAMRLRGQANKEKNGVLQKAKQRQAAQAGEAAGQFKAQLAGLNAQIIGAQNRRHEIAQKKQESIQAALLQGLKLDLDRQGIDEYKRKNKIQQKRAERKKDGGSGKARALDSRASAFITYDTFPLEELRQYFLASLR